MQLRTLRFLGYALWLVAGVPTLIDGFHLGTREAIWLVCFFVFGLAFHFGATVDDGADGRRRRIVALAVQTPAMFAMAACVPCNFGTLNVVIVAWQVALLLAPVHVAGWIVAQTAIVSVLMGQHCALRDKIATFVSLLGFQAFAAIAVYIARRERESRRDLARANAELRAMRTLLEEQSRVQERTRISRELHDVLGHDLTALALQLEVARNVTDGRAKEHVEKAHGVSARLLRGVREVVDAMRAESGVDVGVAIRALVDGLPELEVHLDMPEPLAIDDPQRAHCVLRCVQEIVTNTLRHARARNLWITIARDDHAITVDARDDGEGAPEVRAGNGLGGMRARLEEMGGRLKIAAAPSRAFEVSAWLPVRAPLVGPS